ncbi:MAG: hypothetical protein Q9184_001065 [Pyrenodesmia sp. 2 TL-2023]
MSSGMGLPVPRFHQISQMVRRMDPDSPTIPDLCRLDIHHHNLTGPHIGYNRRQRMERTDQFSSLLSYFQPAVAWLGLIGCLSIVLIFNSASWWNGDFSAKKVLVAYTAPFIFSTTWLSMKTYKHFFCPSRSRGWYVELSDDWEPLSTTLAHLEWKIEEKIGSNGSLRSNSMRVSTTDDAKGGYSVLGWVITRPPKASRRSGYRDVSSLAEAEARDINEMGQSRLTQDLASMASIVSELKYTPEDTIPGIAAGLRNAFNSHKTKPLEFRLMQLRKLYWGIQDNEAAIIQACKEDLGKPTYETYLSEIDWCKNDIVFVTQNLPKWVKDEAAPDIPLANKLLSPKIRKDPLGAVLIIGTYNFPMNLSITPFVGAIAAGCTAVLKPSESAPSVAKVLQHIVETTLDASCYSVVQGGVPETTALLNEKWDKIFYTGGVNVAKIIAKKAAETLTPVTLELGGRNPAIVTKNADVRLAAKRLLWGKVMNAGQVCISQNYIMVDKEIVDAFIAEIKVVLKQFFPNGVKESEDFARIVNVRQWSRLKKMLEDTKGKIVIGGDMDESQRFLEPTVVVVDSPTDPLVADESFGPLLPILPVEDLDTAIRIATEVHRTPLGLYPFGNKVETERIMREVQSGGVSVNDAWTHGIIPTLAFGGVGDSGQGAYRGKSSFDCFSHRRSVTTTPSWMEGLLDIRYPPYKGKLATYKRMSELKPDFDRHGKVKLGLTTYILSLGAGSKTGGLVREALGIPKSTDILDHIHSLPQPAQDEAQTAIRAIERAAMIEQEAQPGLTELMTYLEGRGVKMGLCTRNFDAPVTHLLQTFLPTHTFVPIVTRDFRPPKPDPAGILHIAKAWGLEDGADGLIMVGDSMDE